MGRDHDVVGDRIPHGHFVEQAARVGEGRGDRQRVEEGVVGEGVRSRDGAEEGRRQREAAVGGVTREHGVVGGGGAPGHRGEEALGVGDAAGAHVRRDGLVAPDHLGVEPPRGGGVPGGQRRPVAPLPRRGTEVAGREHGWRLRSSNSVGNSICVTDSRWRWRKTRLAEEREAVLAAAAMGAWRPEQRQSSARRDDARGGDRQWGGEEVGLLGPTRGVARLLSYFVVWASKEFCRAQVGKNIYVSIFELFFPKDRRENELTREKFFF